MDFLILKDQESIHSTIMKFRQDLFNQNLTDDELLLLSKKFASYAFFIVAINEEKHDLGYTAIYCNDLQTKEAFISMIVVGGERRRSGVGKGLFKQAQGIALENGMEAIKLKVDCRNQNAIGFYEKLGFVRTDCDAGMYVYEKKLQSKGDRPNE